MMGNIQSQLQGWTHEWLSINFQQNHDMNLQMFDIVKHASCVSISWFWNGSFGR